MTKEERKSFEGRRFVGNPNTELEGRSGIIHRVKSQERLVLIFDDRPDVQDDGYLFEEITLL